MKLIVTRHGQSEDNRTDPSIFSGRTDSPLSEYGKEQARKLALRLKDHPITQIYTSPLRRALDTAKEIKRYHPDARLIIDDDLAEMDFGIFEGLPKLAAMEKYKLHWDERARDRMNYKIPNGESYQDVYKRMTKVIDTITKSGKDTVIVAHGSLNKTIFMRMLNKSLDDINDINWHNTSISTFNIREEDIKVEELNCTKHLH